MVITELFAKLGLDVDESGISRAATAIGGLKTGLIAIGAAAAGVGVALAGMVKATVDYGSKVNDLAARAGVSTEILQRLGHAASLSGVSMEELAGAMNFAVRKNGVKDLGKEVGVVADKIKALTEKGKGAEAAKLAMERFGKSGASLVPFLREGSAGISALAQEFEDLGLVLDAETIAAADTLGDRIDVANASLKGLAYTIAKPLLRPLTKLVNLFIDWMKVNRKFIAAQIQTVFEKISRALVPLWQLAEGVFWAIKNLVSIILDSKPLLIGIATALAIGPGLAIAAWLALAGVIALVIDDIKTWVEGGDSVVGRLLGDWTDFRKIFDEESEKPTWVLWIEKGWEALKDLKGTWDAIKSEWKAGNFLDNILGELGLKKGSTAARAGPAAVGADAHGGWVGALFDTFSKPSFGGGAVSPDAAVGKSMNAGQSFAPNVTQTLNVTQPSGMSGTDFAKLVADESNKNLEKIFAEAAAGVQ